MKVKNITVYFVIILTLISTKSFAYESDSVIEKAVNAVGGEEALESIETIEYGSRGTAYFTGLDRYPSDPPQLTSTYESTTLNHFKDNRHWINTERDITFPQAGYTNYSEILNDGLGAITGNDSTIGIPTPRAMLADRAAAAHKQQWMLNPLLLLKELHEGTRGYSTQYLEKGIFKYVVTVEDEVAPIKLYLNRKGLIGKLTTIEHSHVLGDVNYSVIYRNWSRVDNTGLRFPHRLKVSVDGDVTLTEKRAHVRVNNSDLERLEFPGELAPPPVLSEVDALRGRQVHFFHYEFNGIGIPAPDGLQLQVIAEELAPGVHRLLGETHHTLAIEQADRVVLVEAPMYEERGQAIVEWVYENIPGKPISHMVMTHYHYDHSGALRRFVAEGAEIVISENSLEFLNEMVNRPRTIRPDRLSLNPVSAKPLAVPDADRILIDDVNNPVAIIHHENTDHAVDMLLVWLPNQEILFTSDVYQPGLPHILPNEFQPLIDEIEKENLVVSKIAGVHGAETSTLQELIDLAEQINND